MTAHSVRGRAMIAERYHLLSQLGAGADGIAYWADDHTTGEQVEVHLLSAARTDADRWPILSKRLRLAALLEHPAALCIRRLQLDADPAFVVLEPAAETSLAETSQAAALPALDEVLRWAEPLANVLAEAHLLGLTHGRLTPSAIRIAIDQSPKLNFTGLDTGHEGVTESSGRLDDSCRAPELAAGAAPDPAADVYGLGATLCCLLTGQPATRRAAGNSSVDKQPLSRFLPTTGDIAAAVKQLLRHMTASDPIDRPSAREVADFLRLLVNPECDTQMLLTRLDATVRPVEAGELPLPRHLGTIPTAGTGWTRWYGHRLSRRGRNRRQYRGNQGSSPRPAR